MRVAAQRSDYTIGCCILIISDAEVVKALAELYGWVGGIIVQIDQNDHDLGTGERETVCISTAATLPSEYAQKSRAVAVRANE